MEEKKDKKPRAKKNAAVIIQQIVHVAPDRQRKDVGTLKQALERAESVILPNRYKLYDLYHDVVSLDGHLSGVLDKRTKAVTNKRLIFVDKSGKKVDVMDSLIQSTKFEQLLEVMMETIYWGTSAVEFVVGGEFAYNVIDRRHIRPEKRQIAISQYDSNGIDIDTLPQVWLIGKTNDLGKLLQCSMYALYKRSGFGDFAQYVEIFGQPVRVVKYDTYDKKTQEELRKALDESGSSLVMMIPKQADFSMLDGKTSNGNGELQERLIQACNQEMSVAILGNSETTTSSKSSGYAQAEVHSEQQMEITLSDMRFVINLLNSGFFLNVLSGYGYPVDGGAFQFEQEQDIGRLKARLDIDRELSQHVPVSDDYWYETYGLPKPDNYDQLKAEQEERRRAIMEGIKSKACKNDEESDEDEDKKKKSVRKLIADFFG